MSGLAKKLLAVGGTTTVSGVLSGSGSLSIPAGVTSITLTGNGSGGEAAVDYYYWKKPTTISSNFGPISQLGLLVDGPSRPTSTPTALNSDVGNSFRFWIFSASSGMSTATFQSGSTYSWIADDTTAYGTLDYTWTYSYTQAGTAGTATTASIQSQNISFAGSATGVVTPPAPTTQTFSGLSGSASSMTYSVPAGGSLSYSYTY